MDYVGLNIGNSGPCPSVSPDGRHCEKPAGHEGPHAADPVQDGADAPACPDCGSPMAHMFTVDAPSEALAARVYASFTILAGLPDEALAALLQHRVHIHLAEGSGADCTDVGPDAGE